MSWLTGVPERCGCCACAAQDMENTTGSWDMYGVDEKKRYPDNQAKFFTQATDIISRRESLRALVALSE